MTIRLLSVTMIAATITFSLFWAMQALVGVAWEAVKAKPALSIDFVRLKRDTTPETKKREIPDRKKPEAPPPPPQISVTENLNPEDTTGMLVPMMEGALDLAVADLGTGGSDRDVVPLVRVEPQYPMSAKQRGIEGWVELMYTITKAGTVKDIQITASHPGSIFNKSAVQAVSKWKYNAKVEQGVAVERPGVRQRIKFQLPR